MELISKLLSLSDEAVAIYLKCLGKNPLTYKEIRSFNLDLSDAKFEEIINELIDNKFFLNKTPKNSQILAHYIAMPPFFLINNMITQIKNDLTERYETKQESDSKVFIDFIKKSEEEIKKIITSELSDIAITLIQLKSELDEKINAIGIEDSQWVMLSNYIKDILALKTHNKAQDIINRISEKFKEFGNITNIQQSISQDDNLFSNIQFIEDFIQIILNYYSELNFFIFDKFWPISSKAKICEEISILLSNSKEKALIIIPEIKDYIVLEELNKFAANLKITLISSESHNNPLIKKVKEIDNIEYLRLKNNNFIGLNKDNDSYIVIGISQENEDDSLKNVIGFGTTYKPLIDQIAPIFLERLKEAKPSNEKQITDGFNKILQNINEIKGKKISKILREILNAAEEMEGNSLNILEIKLLINKLQTINQPLDKETKSQIIEKINKLNDIISKLKLNPPPELTSQPPPKTEMLENISKVDLESITTEEFENLFNLFLEKFNNFNGTTISNQIESLIDLSLEYQGYSTIINWKNQLKSINTVLEEPFKEKLKEDFIKWKNNLIKPKSSEISIQKQMSEPSITKPIASSQNNVVVGKEEYYSPALAENTESAAVVTEEETKIDGSIVERFNRINQNLNNFSGLEISKEMQYIMDIILETIGYSMDLKDMKQWNSRLKKFIKPLDDEIKNQFLPEFNKWRSKYSKKMSEPELLDHTPSFTITEELSEDTGEEQSKGLKGQFDDLIQKVNTLNGVELSKVFLNLIDTLLETKGYSMALKDMRQWLNKIKSIKTPLEEELKIQLLNELEKWKAQFS